MPLLLERHLTWADAFEPAETEGLGMPGEFRGRTGGVLEESAEIADHMEQTFGLEFQAVEDWRKAARNRGTFIGPNL